MVTAYAGPRNIPPPPGKRRCHWLPAALLLCCLILLCASVGALVLYQHTEPPTTITAYVPQTVVTTKEVIKVVTVEPNTPEPLPTQAPIYIYVWASPTPPTDGKG